MGGANNNSSSADRKPLVLSTYLDAQEHLPYADDSAAVTPMSEDNGAIVVPPYTLNNLGKLSLLEAVKALVSLTLDDGNDCIQQHELLLLTHQLTANPFRI